MAMAYKYASYSPDKSNQNGAIIADEHGQVITYGYNTFPPGIVWDEEQIEDRGWKLAFIEHAERNCIYSLIKKNAVRKNMIMVCPWFACTDCARAISLAGIKKVVGHKQRMDQTPDRWKPSVEAGMSILKAGGVEMEFMDGILNASPIIVNGNLWTP